MAKSMALTTRQAQATTYGTRLNSGYIRVYDATGGVPATADTALGSQVLLAELVFGATAFGAPDGSAIVTANAITSDASANNTGTAAFYRTFMNDGTTVVEQGTVGTSGADMIVPTTSVAAGIEFRVTSFTHQVP